MVKRRLNPTPWRIRISRFQRSSSAPWSSGRKAPTGFVTRLSTSPVPSCPYPSALNSRSASMESWKTPSPRWASVCPSLK